MITNCRENKKRFTDEAQKELDDNRKDDPELYSEETDKEDFESAMSGARANSDRELQDN